MPIFTWAVVAAAHNAFSARAALFPDAAASFKEFKRLLAAGLVRGRKEKLEASNSRKRRRALQSIDAVNVVGLGSSNHHLA